jgi:hypothetical protein
MTFHEAEKWVWKQAAKVAEHFLRVSCFEHCYLTYRPGEIGLLREMEVLRPGWELWPERISPAKTEEQITAWAVAILFKLPCLPIE